MKVFKAFYHINAVIKKVIYKIVFGKKISFGKGTTFRMGFKVYLENTGKITIGNNVFFNHNCSVNCLDSIEIGDNCLFGENVKIYDQNHKFSKMGSSDLISEQGFTTSPVKIGNNCWICSNVTILKGVSIGDNCVIGANSLVYKDIPSNSVVKNKSELIIDNLN